MNTRMWSWRALPLLLLLSGCPDGGGRDGGIGGGSSGTIVYRADQTNPNSFEIFLVDSGARLNPGPLAAPRTVQTFAITPDRSSVVYIADQETAGVFELYLVALTNPGIATKLNTSGASGISGGKDVINFRVIPDGSGVIYLADQDTDGVNELYRVSVSLPGIATKLNPDLAVGRNVVEYDVTANSDSVVYSADQHNVGVVELYRTVLSDPVPVTTNIKLHADFPAGRSITTFKLLPDNSGVIYLADEATDEVFELFRASFGVVGGNRANKNFTLPGSDVLDFVISPDSSSVVYRADQDTDGVNELYRVTLSNLGTSIQLNNPGMPSSGNVNDNYVVTPDSFSVIYIADEDSDDRFELYRSTLSGTTRTKLTGSLIVGNSDVYGVVTIPDNSGVVYIADQDSPGTKELYRVLYAASGVSLKLNPTLAIGQQVNEVVVAPDSRSAIYRANETVVTAVELYRSFFATAGSSTKLNGTLVSGGNVTSFTVR